MLNSLWLLIFYIICGLFFSKLTKTWYTIYLPFFCTPIWALPHSFYLDVPELAPNMKMKSICPSWHITFLANPWTFEVWGVSPKVNESFEYVPSSTLSLCFLVQFSLATKSYPIADAQIEMRPNTGLVFNCHTGSVDTCCDQIDIRD